jgi:GSH-dependent disulfide-bond oxidoreductase
MIDLYAWYTPNPLKVSVMLEEVKLEYRTIFVDPLSPAVRDPKFLALNPNNKIPVIVDHTANGQTVFESGAILIYLAEKVGSPLLPTDPSLRAATFQWLMLQMSGVGPMMGQLFHFTMAAPEKLHYAIARYDAEMKRLFSVLEKRLSRSSYLAGDAYTIADIATYPWWAKGSDMFGVDTTSIQPLKPGRVELVRVRPLCAGWPSRSEAD